MAEECYAPILLAPPAGRPPRRVGVDSITEAITEIQENLRQTLGEHPVLACLLSVPGFGFLTSAAFLTEVGDVERFPRARHLVSYLGLAPRVRASGGHLRIGSLIKEGPPLVRSYLVRVVQNAIRSPGPCQELFERVRNRSGSQMHGLLWLASLLSWPILPGSSQAKGRCGSRS